jgi:hypothetical protein
MVVRSGGRTLTRAERRGLIILWSFWSIALLIAAGFALLGFLAFDWETSLNVAIAVVAGFILCTALVTHWWIWRYLGTDGAGDQLGSDDTAGLAPSSANPFADAAKLSITTQGVVLGLIAFAGPEKPNLTLKAGSTSLAAGVLVASLLYFQVATRPPPDANRLLAASILFNLLLWMLGFGLVCVVAGSWSA